MKQSEKFDNSGMVIDNLTPKVFDVRFFPDDDGDTLTIYDSGIGPEYGEEKIHLDKTNPTMDFGVEGLPFANGLYAFLPRGGSFYVTWQD